MVHTVLSLALHHDIIDAMCAVGVVRRKQQAQASMKQQKSFFSYAGNLACYAAAPAQVDP
jgi:hypothetical protein